MNKKWYVLYTKSRCEKKVAALLTKKNIENYCPLNKIVKQWADRKKLIQEPLFNSYVFVRANEIDIYDIKKLTTDIVNFVYWLKKPAIIKDEEIEHIKLFLTQHKNIQLEKLNIQVNDKVRIISGPLMNVEGNITVIKNNTVKLMLPSLGYMMVAEVGISNIKVIEMPNLLFNTAHT